MLSSSFHTESGPIRIFPSSHPHVSLLSARNIIAGHVFLFHLKISFGTEVLLYLKISCCFCLVITVTSKDWLWFVGKSFYGFHYFILLYMLNLPLTLYSMLCYVRKLEDILDAFADRVSKPRLFITDKMQIALGRMLKIFTSFWFLVFGFDTFAISPRIYWS